MKKQIQGKEIFAYLACITLDADSSSDFCHSSESTITAFASFLVVVDQTECDHCSCIFRVLFFIVKALKID